jgi:protein associated with RNAse G/E
LRKIDLEFRSDNIKYMASKNILIKEGKGVAILDLEEYQELRRKIAEYEKKEKLLRSLEKFESLAKWGRSFAKKRKFTQKQVLEND